MRTKRELYQEAMRTVALRRQAARANAEDARAEAEAAFATPKKRCGCGACGVRWPEPPAGTAPLRPLR